MQELQALQKVRAVEKIGEFSKPVSVQKNKSPDKPSFAELVEKARNEKLEKQKSDKIKTDARDETISNENTSEKVSDEKKFSHVDENEKSNENDEIVKEKNVSKNENHETKSISENDVKLFAKTDESTESESNANAEVLAENFLQIQNAQTQNENLANEVTFTIGDVSEVETTIEAVPNENETLANFISLENTNENTEALQVENFVAENVSMSENVLHENDDEKTAKEFALTKDGKISVLDLRSENVIDESVKTSASAKKVSLVSETQMNTENLQAVFSENTQLQAQENHEITNATNFQTLLMNQINEHTNDFVEAGKIILRDNDTGTINLILKPESLGNVKIHLELTDKGVRGEIVVRSQEAFDAFKNSGESLRHAFEQSGFENASFSLSYNGNGSEQNANENFSHAQKIVFANADAYETETRASANAFENYNGQVNVLA